MSRLSLLGFTNDVNVIYKYVEINWNVKDITQKHKDKMYGM